MWSKDAMRHDAMGCDVKGLVHARARIVEQMPRNADLRICGEREGAFGSDASCRVAVFGVLAMRVGRSRGTRGMGAENEVMPREVIATMTSKKSMRAREM
jgi:hypothetical protein